MRLARDESACRALRAMRRCARARLLDGLTVCMSDSKFDMELSRSFPRDWVTAVCRVEIPGNLEPGQAEACPHTAAITQKSGHKKSACNRDGALRAPSFQRVSTPDHGIDHGLANHTGHHDGVQPWKYLTPDPQKICSHQKSR